MISQKIANLYYGTIEDIIADHYNLGSPDSSNIPPEMAPNESGSYILVGTRASGEFSITVKAQPDGSYWLMAHVIGKISKS